jgi:2-dehydropantoate 2-reductase
MKIAIIGGGAIGLLFSYYLGQTHQVTLYTRTKGQADLINREGLTIVDGDKTVCQSIEVKQVEHWDGSDDITFITVKEHQLSSIISMINQQSKKIGSLFFLQNGMGHLKWLPETRAESIYLGSIEHGAARVKGHIASHNGHGVTRVAVYKGSDNLLRELLATTTSGFPFAFEQDYEEMLVKKLIVNLVINPLTAAFQVTNGTLLTNPFYYKVALQVFDEAAKVLNIHNKEEHWLNVLSVCKQTSTNRSSMLKDIEAGRKTEVDAILGYLLEESRAKQISVPVIRNYFNLIKGKEFQRGGD